MIIVMGKSAEAIVVQLSCACQITRKKKSQNAGRVRDEK